MLPSGFTGRLSQPRAQDWYPALPSTQEPPNPTPTATIRSERSDDIPAIRAINEAAFGPPAEGAVVDAIRAGCTDMLSLVAEEEGEVVGHILFSPASATGPDGPVVGMGLAPMAVAPGRQRQGIGSDLVRAGLDVLRQRGCPFVIVLGHAEYYPRFGFEPASRHGLACQWDGVPDDVFLALMFDADAMDGVQGIARYRDEFDAAM